MKLRTKFKIISAVVMGLFLVVGFFVFSQVRELEREIEENRIASEIMKGAFELNLLTGDYLSRPEARIQEQWYLRYQSIEELLKRDIFRHLREQRHEDERMILDILQKDHEAIQTTFLELTESLESQEFDEKEASMAAELEERLVAELSLKSQAIVSGASSLMEGTREELVNVQQKTGLLILVSFTVLAGIFLLVLLVIIGSILRPILFLKKGAEIIGGGNLEHRIEIKRKDEIGALAQAFNQMVDNLFKGVTDRQRAEGELKTRSEELERMNKLMVGRELKMAEMKKEMEELKSKGQERR